MAPRATTKGPTRYSPLCFPFFCFFFPTLPTILLTHDYLLQALASWGIVFFLSFFFFLRRRILRPAEIWCPPSSRRSDNSRHQRPLTWADAPRSLDDAPNASRTPNAAVAPNVCGKKKEINKTKKRPENSSTVGMFCTDKLGTATRRRHFRFVCWWPRHSICISDGDSVQAEHLGLVSQELGAEFNDPPGYCVEVFDFVRLELLEELPQSLDETVLLLAAIVVGIAKLQEDLVIWKGRGPGVSVERGESWKVQC